MRTPFPAPWLLFLALVSGAATAAPIVLEVEGVGRGNVLTGRPVGDTGLYPRGAGICFYRANRGVACGHVIEAGGSLMRVQLTHGTNRFTPGEKLRANVAEKFTKTVDAPEPPPPASSSVSSEPSARGTPRFLVGAGAAVNFASSSYFNFLVNAQYSFGHLAVGLKPIVIPYSELLGIGGLVGAYYYLSPGFREFFGGLALGVLSLDGKTPTQSETITTLCGQLMIGYRLPVGKSFNLSADAGFTYIAKTKGDRIDYNLNTFIPMFEVDGALTF